MKIVIEIVATNMDTGHVAVSQHSFDHAMNMNREKTKEYAKQLMESMKPYSEPKKIGPLLIVRNIVYMPY